MNKKYWEYSLASVVAMGSMGEAYTQLMQKKIVITASILLQKTSTLVFIPKVVHTWYEGVKLVLTKPLQNLRKRR